MSVKISFYQEAHVQRIIFVNYCDKSEWDPWRILGTNINIKNPFPSSIMLVSITGVVMTHNEGGKIANHNAESRRIIGHQKTEYQWLTYNSMGDTYKCTGNLLISAF